VCERLEMQVADSSSKKSVDDVEQQQQQQQQEDDDVKDEADNNEEAAAADANESSVRVNESSLVITAPRDTAYDRDQMLTRCVLTHTRAHTQVITDSVNSSGDRQSWQC